MFQNIKDILTTFTPGQRLIALLLLLFSLCIISVGPKIINILSHDDTLIQKRLDLQKELIDKQGQEIKKLNDTIIFNQINCTNRLIQRERQLYSMVDDVIKNEERKIRKNNSRSPASVDPMIDSITIVSNDNTELIKGLRNIKRELFSSIIMAEH